MNLIEMTISILAPHTCIICGKEGVSLCEACLKTTLVALPPGCYRCGRSLNALVTCPECASLTSLRQVWLGTAYTGAIKEAIALLKFNRAKAMSVGLASWLDVYLPALPRDTIITHVPTAYSRIRLRGYDQAQLIAKAFARKRRLSYKDTLRRVKNTRQVGSTRAQRFKQLDNAFAAHKPNQLTGRPVLLIDDVLTTGATLESAARTLHQSGIQQVDAAVAAYALPKNRSKSTFSSSTRNAPKS